MAGTATIAINPTVAVTASRVLLTTAGRGAVYQATIARNK
jgi:hypothetical protein